MGANFVIAVILIGIIFALVAWYISAPSYLYTHNPRFHTLMGTHDMAVVAFYPDRVVHWTAHTSPGPGRLHVSGASDYRYETPRVPVKDFLAPSLRGGSPGVVLGYLVSVLEEATGQPIDLAQTRVRTMAG